MYFLSLTYKFLYGRIACFNIIAMDAKVTLSFNKEVIEGAKKFAAEHDISLSRLTEFLYSQIITGNFENLEEFPISDWVHEVAEGRTEYQTRPTSRKDMKDEYFRSRR